MELIAFWRTGEPNTSCESVAGCLRRARLGRQLCGCGGYGNGERASGGRAYGRHLCRMLGNLQGPMLMMKKYILLLLFPVLVVACVLIELISDWDQITGLLVTALLGSVFGLVLSTVDAVAEIRAGRADSDRFARKTIFRCAMSIFLFVVGLSALFRHHK